MIIYLHGFRSSPASMKSQMLKQHMEKRGLGNALWSQQLPASPAAAIPLIEHAIATAPTRPTLVGSSLGGFYATALAERHVLPAILINPAVMATQSAEKWIGTHTMLHSNETFEFTADDIAVFAALDKRQLSHAANYWLLVEQKDEVLDYRDAVAYYAGARQTILPGGNHSFSRWADYLDQIIAFAGLAP